MTTGSLCSGKCGKVFAKGDKAHLVTWPDSGEEWCLCESCHRSWKKKLTWPCYGCGKTIREWVDPCCVIELAGPGPGEGEICRLCETCRDTKLKRRVPKEDETGIVHGGTTHGSIRSGPD